MGKGTMIQKVATGRTAGRRRITPVFDNAEKTNILVIGEGYGPKKYEKASERGITIMSEPEFLGYINS